MLDSFSQAISVAVIGASGGIGRAIVDRLASHPGVARVHALSRSPLDLDDSKVVAGTIDICDESSIARAARSASAGGELDIVIVATGILHRPPSIGPEKSMRELSAPVMAEVMAINAIGPAIAARHFLPTLARKRKTVFAALSARVGSIGDNRLGGWTSYRASKAALNMILKTLAIEHARRNPESVIAGLHPGTVDTRLSQPFSRGIPEDRLFTPDRAAVQLLGVIDGLTPADTGGFFSWDGKPVPF